MRIINKRFTQSFQGRPCEWCGAFIGTVAHHVLPKGMGGGGQMDVPYNLLALCKDHHQAHHDGNEPTTEQLLAIVARRENTTPEAVLEELYRLRRLTKDGKFNRPDA